MTVIHKNIKIKAPVNKVYSYINDPKNEPRWLPNMVEVKNVTGTGVGTHYEWSWKIGEMKFKGESTKIEDVHEQRIEVRSKGEHGVESKWIYNLKNKGDAIYLDLVLEYLVPPRVLGRQVEKLIMKNNERDMSLALINIKNHMEERGLSEY